MKQACILANGQFPSRAELLQILKSAPLIVCCDGAYVKLLDSNLLEQSNKPQVHVVGDGDSLAERRTTPWAELHFVEGYTDQECNDLTKSVRYAMTLGVEDVVILGATGLREDHTLGNVSLLAEYARMTTAGGAPLKVTMLTDYGRFLPLLSDGESRYSFGSFARQQVSLFCLDPRMILSVSGLRYPIEHRCLHSWWEGSLNEALGERFEVVLESPGALLLYQTHDAKE